MGTEFAGLKEVLTSSQALEASSLVGKKVLIDSNVGYLSESDDLSGSINTDTGASNVTVSIENSAGSVVRNIGLGDISTGNTRFSWDGLDAEGNRLPQDTYTLKANGNVNGTGEQLFVNTYAHVESVSLGGGQTSVNLNLKGLNGIALSDAIEVAENK